MTTLWQPDSCDCAIELDNNWNLVKVHARCKLHAKIPPSKLLKTIEKHRKDLDLLNTPEDTQDDIKKRVAARRKEKMRIRKLA